VVSGHLADLWKFAGFDDLLGHLVAVVEHSPQFRLDEPASEKITQLAQGWKIVELVTKDGSPLAIVEEKMPVIPVGEGPAHLSVGEHPDGFVFRMLGNPEPEQGADSRPQDYPRTRP